MISKKHKKSCTTLDSSIIESISISAFASTIVITIGITSSLIGLKICTITAGIKKYN